MHVAHIDGLASDIFFREVLTKTIQPSVFQVIQTRNNMQRYFDRGERLFRFLKIRIGPGPRKRAEHHQRVGFERLNRLDRPLDARRSGVLDETATGSKFCFRQRRQVEIGNCSDPADRLFFLGKALPRSRKDRHGQNCD